MSAEITVTTNSAKFAESYDEKLKEIFLDDCNKFPCVISLDKWKEQTPDLRKMPIKEYRDYIFGEET